MSRDWIASGIAPKTAGVFEVRVPTLTGQKLYARWTGVYWTNWAMSAKAAARLEWRGVRAYDWRPIFVT
jgi:hypothetical protein